jgi:tellurite resistance protein TerA
MAIELSKGQKVSLSKRTGTSIGQVIVNLNWTQKIQRKGFFGSLKTSRPIDLDLGCLFKLKNGRSHYSQGTRKSRYYCAYG